MSYNEYTAMQELKEQHRHRDALTTLRRLQATVRTRNPGLTDEQANALADCATRDAIHGLIETGKVRFEGASG